MIKKIKLSFIHLNPMEEAVFEKRNLEELKDEIRRNEFKNLPIKVFKLKKDVFQLYSNYDVVIAAKELGIIELPVFVSPYTNSYECKLAFLTENLHTRQPSTMDIARSIRHYLDYVVIDYLKSYPEKKIVKFGKMEKKTLCANSLNLSKVVVERYQHLSELIIPLQDLINEGQPVTGFISAHRLSGINQEVLYNQLRQYQLDYALKSEKKILPEDVSIPKEYILKQIQIDLEKQGNKIAMPRRKKKESYVEENRRINEVNSNNIVPSENLPSKSRALIIAEMERDFSLSGTDPMELYFRKSGVIPLENKEVDPILQKMIYQLDAMNGISFSDIQKSYLYNIAIRALSLSDYPKK